MKNIYKKQKRNYIKPQIESIKLDHEISVFMNSSDTPPGDPSGAINPENFKNDPFKISKA